MTAILTDNISKFRSIKMTESKSESKLVLFFVIVIKQQWYKLCLIGTKPPTELMMAWKVELTRAEWYIDALVNQAVIGPGGEPTKVVANVITFEMLWGKCNGDVIRWNIWTH